MTQEVRYNSEHIDVLDLIFEFFCRQISKDEKDVTDGLHRAGQAEISFIRSPGTTISVNLRGKRAVLRMSLP